MVIVCWNPFPSSHPDNDLACERTAVENTETIHYWFEFMSLSLNHFGKGFRFAIPAEALGSQRLRDRAAHRLRIVTFGKI